MNNSEVLSLTNVPLLQRRPGLAIPYVITLLLCCLLGTFGNILVIVSICKTKKLQTIGNILILNLAVADLCVCAVADISAVTGAVVGPTVTLYKPICELGGGAIVLAVSVSFLSVTLISVHRFVHICLYRICDKIFTKYSSCGLIILTWAIGLMIALRHEFRWMSRGYVFDDKLEQCFYDRDNSSIIIPIVGPILFVLVTLSYFGILCFVKRHNNIIQRRSWNNERRNSIKLAYTSFLVVSLYISLIPCTVIFQIDKSSSLPQDVYIFSVLVAYSTSSFNWIIYAATNLQFKKAFKQTLWFL